MFSAPAELRVGQGEVGGCPEGDHGWLQVFYSCLQIQCWVSMYIPTYRMVCFWIIK